MIFHPRFNHDGRLFVLSCFVRFLSYSGDTTFHEWLLGRDIILMSVALVDSNQRSYIIYGRHTTAHAFFLKKTAKNFVVSIIIPNFALAFRPEAYYKTIVG